MIKKKNQTYFSNKGLKNSAKAKTRREKYRQIKSLRKKVRNKKTKVKHKSPFQPYIRKRKFLPPPRPNKHNEYVKYFASIPNVFSKTGFRYKNDAPLFIPPIFSLIDNYEASFDFLKQLFTVLYKGKTNTLPLDYSKCTRIDVDASICMDFIIAQYLQYINPCNANGYKAYPSVITPVNFDKEDIKKVLFSIGAYKNLRNLTIKYADVEPLPVLINDNRGSNVWAISEIQQTQTVDYIKRCLQRMNRELNQNAETELYKVIGEIMSNAEEHATMRHRYAIGFFQENHDADNHFGIFNFSIFNFGDTIYQSFTSRNCKNPNIVNQMKSLSESYTKKGWFRSAEFEEETLWTLYALQEGVTSKEKKRGNGSIQFIENFFRLKGDMEKDNISKLVIVSGNTRIEFDGTYNIIEKEKIGVKRKFKMMTFNRSGNISEKPDEKFVTFAPNFFPGTLISARILIKHDNINTEKNSNERV